MASKRAELLAAAKTLLWERGFAGMSPRAVLAASGAGQGSLYHHFAGKAELAAAALSEVEAELRQSLDRTMDRRLPPLRRVEAYLALPRDGLRGCRLGRLANEPALADDRLRQPVAGYFDHVEAAIEAALGEARHHGDLPPTIDVAALATTLVATVQGGYVLSRVHGDPAMMERASAGAIALLRAAASPSSDHRPSTH